MTLPDLAAEAIAVLTGTRWPIGDAPAQVESCPGLYAIYCDEQGHRDLGLSRDSEADSATDLPIYIGKAETSVLTRDLKDHFAALPGSVARTGQSTVRRSFAALLGHQLGLHAVPRNLEKPGYFSMYALAGDGEPRLTAWMHDHLSLAVWPSPEEMSVTLVDVESALIRHFIPPINIDENPRKLKRLVLARRAMAAEAREWRPAQN